MGGFDLAAGRGRRRPGRGPRRGRARRPGVARRPEPRRAATRSPGEPRFSMLEPIREYALERLEATGDRGRRRASGTPARTWRSPRSWRPSSTATASGPRSTGSSASTRTCAPPSTGRDARGDAEVALGITIAVWRMWQKRGYLREARVRVAALVARPWFAGAPPELRAKTHEVMGGIIYWHGEVYGARPDYEAALAIWREVGDRREIANALYNLSFCFTMGVLDEELPPDARSGPTPCSTRRSRPTARWATTSARPTCTGASGSSTTSRDDDAPAAPAFEAALALYRKLGDRTQEAWSLHQLGTRGCRLGELERRPPAAGARACGCSAGGRRRRRDARARRPGRGRGRRRRPVRGPPALGARPAHPGLVGHRPRGRRGEGVRGGDRGRTPPA